MTFAIGDPIEVEAVSPIHGKTWEQAVYVGQCNAGYRVRLMRTGMVCIVSPSKVRAVS